MLSIIVASMLAAAEASPAVPAKPVGAQAMFNTASEAADAGRCSEAVTGFEALEARPGTRKNVEVLAVIRLRKGSCLYELNRLPEAETAFREGLAGLRSDNPTYRIDIARAQLGVGKIAYRNYDYAEAKRSFEAARLALPPADQFEALLWLTRATMFDEGPEALAYADAAVALAAAEPSITKSQLADILTLHARVLLNRGAHAAAYAKLKKALADKGGLTNQVRVADIVTRSDLALAALLTGDKESARKYLAYTGAGRNAKGPFGSAARMDPPVCGGPAEGLPDDFAVIEFSINDDGSVGYANPIYASRNGSMAANYARAVTDWSWTPEAAKTLGPVSRAVMRVELRCSTSFERPSVHNLLYAGLDGWLKREKAQAYERAGSDAAGVPPAKRELERRRNAGETVGLIPVLVSLGRNPVTPVAESQSLMREANDIAVAAGAPASARLFLEFNGRAWQASRGRDGNKYRAALRQALIRPEIAADARAAAALRLLIAEGAYRSPAPADASALLAASASDTRLAADDPLRISTLVRLASLQANAGDLASARDSYAKTGLDAQQCALIDAKPALRRTNTSSADFPIEAQRWGFEGWVKMEYDITASGKTASPRAVIAYPPLVFRSAAVSIVKDMQYKASFRPDGAAGCGGAQQGINFKMSDR